MLRLMLLRHAKTERAEPGGRDRDRKLMPRGRSDAPAVGAYMARHGLVPDLALVSTATRAQETWALVAPCFAKAPAMRSDERMYNATSEKLAAILSEVTKTRSLVMVGHNPGLHDLAVILSGSGDDEARIRIAEGLPTSGLAVIELPFDDWAVLQPRAGHLVRFISPRLIAAAAD